MPLRLESLALSLMLAGTAATASAGQGDHIHVVNSEAAIILTYLSGEAGNTNILYLDQPSAVGPIFNNKAASNPEFDLGSFLAGTELVFRLNSDGADNWFSGPASRNSDLFAHAVVTDLGDNIVKVEFEDLPNGGDLNFGDMVFTVSNAMVVTAVPEPASYAFMLAGLGLVAWGSRRRAGRSTHA